MKKSMNPHDHCDCHEHRHEEAADRYHEVLNRYPLHLHDDEVHTAVHTLLKRCMAENDTPEVYRSLLGMLDVTSLKITDTEEQILALVEQLNTFCNEHPELPQPAALCVYPNFASLASQSLEPEQTAVACVAGGFPSAQMAVEAKIVEVSLALNDGATEIDTVLPVGLFLSENYEEVSDQLGEMKAICNDKKLKVILETGVLQSASQIKKAALVAMYSGADFIKTSTGKLEPGATPEAAYVMCQAIHEYHKQTGRKVGFKAAGGLNSLQDALTYYTIVKELLGEEWLTPQLFRLGTSRLYRELTILLTR